MMNTAPTISIIIAAAITAVFGLITSVFTVGVTLYFTRNKTSAESSKSHADALKTMQGLVNDLSEQVSNLSDKLRRTQETVGELFSIKRVLEQVERNVRVFYDELGIAYWEADKDGNCIYANQTFQDLTGLTPEKCKNSGWFEGVHVEDRARVQYLWRKLVANTDTQLPLPFRFTHLKTKKSAEVVAHAQAIYSQGFEIYKYTARTKPIDRQVK